RERKQRQRTGLRSDIGDDLRDEARRDDYGPAGKRAVDGGLELGCRQWRQRIAAVAGAGPESRIGEWPVVEVRAHRRYHAQLRRRIVEYRVERADELVAISRHRDGPQLFELVQDEQQWPRDRNGSQQR